MEFFLHMGLMREEIIFLVTLDSFKSACNRPASGSSANLVAFSTLTSPKLGDRAIKKGDEVIIPEISWVATAQAAAYTGATCVFVDVDPATFCIDPEKIRAAITKKTKAIMVVHCFSINKLL